VLDTTTERFSLALFRRKEIQYRLWALVLTAIEAVLLKKVILFSNVTIAFFAWCGFGAVFSAVLLPVYRVRLSAEVKRFTSRQLVHFVCLILCLGIMQLTTNYVFDHMQVGYALALFQLSTIVSVLLGYRIFKEQEIPKKLLGAAIMLLGSVLIILLK
jgi:drug/metabolite transporter (DMT)-like permease